MMAEVGGRETASFLAIDLGASSGKVVLGRFDGTSFDDRTVHRFENQPVRVLGSLYWDTLRSCSTPG